MCVSSIVHTLPGIPRLSKTYPFQKDLLGAYELSTMSTIPVEVAEEALEKKVEAMKIVDGNNMEVKKETTDGKNERRERKVSEARNAVCNRTVVYVVLVRIYPALMPSLSSISIKTA
ncbi:hypothetical protein Y032_0019g3826 [Ancylostoma ceylanicum]|uniref:Uncharacterized protein n=1 Tax=Ancylostoma ceylanicum TaxID=53326 RepID=A0A016V3Z2_9BILA|nr:hypothetical protein Y032_0019g3826 [Ancylostoma ceylanicum]